MSKKRKNKAWHAKASLQNIQEKTLKTQNVTVKNVHGKLFQALVASTHEHSVILQDIIKATSAHPKFTNNPFGILELYHDGDNTIFQWFKSINSYCERWDVIEESFDVSKKDHTQLRVAYEDVVQNAMHLKKATGYEAIIISFAFHDKCGKLPRKIAKAAREFHFLAISGRAITTQLDIKNFNKEIL